MEEFEMLKTKVDQIQVMIDGLVMEMLQNAGGGNNGAVGPGVIAMPILSDDGGTAGCYEIESMTISGSTASIEFENAYFRVGGKTYQGSTSISGVGLPAIVAIKVSATGSQPPTSTVESYANIAALQADEADQNYYIFPLYSLDASGAITCDFRIGPETSMGEY